MREAIFLAPLPAGPCDVHSWPSANLAARLVSAMRLMHGRGGVTVCADCIHRAHADARTRLRGSR